MNNGSDFNFSCWTRFDMCELTERQLLYVSSGMTDTVLKFVYL